MRFTPNLLREAGEILLLLLGCPRHLRCSGVQVIRVKNGSGVLEQHLPAAGEVLVLCFSFQLFLSHWFSPACPGDAVQAGSSTTGSCDPTGGKYLAEQGQGHPSLGHMPDQALRFSGL